jgi:hypothetical protein
MMRLSAILAGKALSASLLVSRTIANIASPWHLLTPKGADCAPSSASRPDLLEVCNLEGRGTLG